MSDLPPALLLDLDDTILSFSTGAEPAWREVLAREASSAAEADELYAAIRAAADHFWSDSERARRGRLDIRNGRREIVGAALGGRGVDDPEGVARIVDAYAAIRERNVEPFPGAVEAVREFRVRGVRLGLLSNGAADSQRAKVERFNLGELFDYVGIEGELGVGKPDARVFEMALEGLGVAREEAWMVGDNLEADIGGAQAVGIHGVWHDFDRRGLPQNAAIHPDRIVHSLGELL